MPIVQVYPNIVDRDISLLFENWIETNVQIDLIDPLGKSISNWQIDVPQSDMHKQLSLPNLTPGLYLIKIKTKHNDWNFKIQKQ
ncbi:MAG: T9SS type A sorting domain-containing protein [Bacteroidota bacterium]|nr:T9SS type A sorting domain-containing protein [Bacteroidota bacterium]